MSPRIKMFLVFTILVVLVRLFGPQSDVLAAAIIYVNQAANGANDGTSWTNAYTDLQSALSNTTSGDQIWVAKGTYKPTTGTDRTISFMLKEGVKVYGGFGGGETDLSHRNWIMNETILSGDLKGDDGQNFNNNSENSYHVLTSADLTAAAGLDGFTIRGGNANGYISGKCPGTGCGGGMYNINASSPSLSNLIFTSNAAINGGGLANINNSSPSLTNVIFSRNSASRGGGIFNTNFSSPILSNVTFRGNAATYGGGINNQYSSSPSLTNVTFSGNSAAYGGGMDNYPGSTPSLTNVTFSGNSASYGGGISNEVAHPRLTNVTFSGNSADYGGGMFNNSGFPSLTNVTFNGNSALFGGAMYNFNACKTKIYNSILWGDTVQPGGLGQEILNYGSPASIPDVQYSIIQGGHTGTGNVDDDPQFVDASGGNLHLQPTSPAIDSGSDALVPTGITTDLDGNLRINYAAVDMGAYEYWRPHYVKWDANGANNGTSWNNAYTDLQSALSAANSGDQIWVAEGTYKPTTGIDRTVSFLLKEGVKVYGGFVGTETALDQRNWQNNLTILSGDLNGDDEANFANNIENSYHVVTGSSITATAVLDGFIIRGGNANEAVSYPSGFGGAMSNINSSPTLANLTISGNAAINGGGIFNDNSSPILTNVTFSDNSASSDGGGMHNRSNSSPSLTHVTFSGNTASSGGGMYNHSSSPILTNLTFSGNTTSYGGGGMFNESSSSPSLTNVNFIGNATTYGGAMYNYSSSPTLTNVTSSGNSANRLGGGLYNINNSSPTISNSILWGDINEELFNSSSTATVQYSLVQGGWSGTGNLDSDPQFVDASGSNLTLLDTSPAVDAGSNALIPAGINIDLSGNPRLVNGVVDMGAYEVQTLSQTITFDPLVDKSYGDPDFTLSASASSGLPVTFTSSGNCTISGSTVHLVEAGICTITASQAGDGTYRAAANVARSFSIEKANATLSFDTLNFTYDGSPKPVMVTTTPAGLTGISITYNGLSTPPEDAGSYAVAASLINANYQAADINGTLVIAKADQTITFSILANKTYGDPDFTLGAIASSGLTVTFTASGNCSISGSTVHLTGVGNCTITASQAGNSNYNAAQPVVQSFSIASYQLFLPVVMR